MPVRGDERPDLAPRFSPFYFDDERLYACAALARPPSGFCMTVTSVGERETLLSEERHTGFDHRRIEAATFAG